MSLIYTPFSLGKDFGPVHMSWPIFFKTDIFFSVITFLPHVNGVFVHRKCRFLKTVSSRSVLLNASLSFK